MRFDGAREQFAGAVLKLRDAEIREARLQQRGFHALNFDDGARQRQFNRIGFALAHDGETDRGIGFAAHLFHCIVQRHAFDRRIVELDDQVAGQHAGARRGRVVDG